MKLNLSLVKLIIRMLILMILFVLLFMISAFLYSAKYWPDVYNYVNANITIARIPTISELNLTVYEVVEFHTEGYTSADGDYADVTTNEYDKVEEYTFAFEDVNYPKSKVKRNAKLEDMETDYSEVPKKSVVVDYFLTDDDGVTTKLIKDLVDESKLTARDVKDVEVMSELRSSLRYPKMTVESCNGHKMVQLSGAVFPWIATIFVKNESKGDQFDYFCDGAVVSESAVLTAARCTHNGSHFVSADNFIVILGKTSLQVSRGDENILRVKEVKRHENFTIKNGKTENNLAVLNLEDSVALNNAINKVCLSNDEESAESDEQNMEAVTTAWSLSGDLTLIYFDKEKSKACGSDNKVENTFCATYGNDVALCPSYGGLYVSKSSSGGVYLQGLRTGNPLDRGICYNKDVTYTSLKYYIEWIDANVKAVKNK